MIDAFVSDNKLILSRLQNSAPYSAIFINLFYLNKSWKVAARYSKTATLLSQLDFQVWEI